MGFEAKEFLLDKYIQDHNPSSALELLKCKIFRIDSGLLADRSLVPSQADSYRYVYIDQSIKLLDQCRALSTLFLRNLKKSLLKCWPAQNMCLNI